jgi:hypothetical protein
VIWLFNDLFDWLFWMFSDSLFSLTMMISLPSLNVNGESPLVTPEWPMPSRSASALA